MQVSEIVSFQNFCRIPLIFRLKSLDLLGPTQERPEHQILDVVAGQISEACRSDLQCLVETIEHGQEFPGTLSFDNSSAECRQWTKREKGTEEGKDPRQRDEPITPTHFICLGKSNEHTSTSDAEYEQNYL